MPTYDYECPKCGHTFERFQGINDPPLKTCPKCKGRKVKRLIGTGAGIIFKGSGFYATDYRSKDYRRDAKSDSGAPAKVDGSASKVEGGAKPESAAKAEKPKDAKQKPKTAKGKSSSH